MDHVLDVVAVSDSVDDLKYLIKVIEMDFVGYTDDLIGRMWNYAKMSGFKEYLGVMMSVNK